MIELPRLGLAELVVDQGMFKKNYHCTFWPKYFSTTFFRILPENFSFYLSKFLKTFFSHRPFFLNIIQISPISYCLNTLYPLHTHRHAVFPFLHLTFYSRNSKYYVYVFYFFLLHHCTAFHHCIFSFITAR